MALVIELVPHLDAGDRTKWVGDQDLRPLSELGQRQAVALADLLAAEPVHALVSSPALRCRQTLVPLASMLGLAVSLDPDLRETYGLTEPAAWISGTPQPIDCAVAGTHVVGRGLAALARIRAAHRRGRVIACSHGDLLPVLVACLAGLHGATLPSVLAGRGGWYTVRFAGGRVTLDTHQALPDFPHA